MFIKDKKTDLEKWVPLFKTSGEKKFIKEMNRDCKTEWFYNKELKKLLVKNKILNNFCFRYFNNKKNKKIILKIENLLSEVKEKYINTNIKFIKKAENIINKYYEKEKFFDALNNHHLFIDIETHKEQQSLLNTNGLCRQPTESNRQKTKHSTWSRN